MEAQESINNLKLHEKIKISSNCSVMRVPGGLIYYFSEQIIEGHGYCSISIHTQFIEYRLFNR